MVESYEIWKNNFHRWKGRFWLRRGWLAAWIRYYTIRQAFDVNFYVIVRDDRWHMDRNDRCFCIRRPFFFFNSRELSKGSCIRFLWSQRDRCSRETLTMLSDRLDDSRLVHAVNDTFSRITYYLMDPSYRDTLIFQVKFLERILRLD